MRIDYSKLKCYCGSCGWKAEFIPAKRRPGPHKADCPRCGSSRICLYEKERKD